jgi:hypothetical protein
MRQRNQVPAFAVGVLAALALGAAQAEPQQPQAQAAPTGVASAPVTEAQSMRAVRDKATGKLRAPTADELETMHSDERAERKARGLPETAEPAPLRVQLHANGMRSAVLGPDFLVTLKGERRADGSVRRFHPDGNHEHSVDLDKRPTE